MDAKELEILSNQDIPESVRSTIAEKMFGAADRVAERELETKRLQYEQQKARWNTPFVAALAGLLTLSATFVFDRITASDETDNTITLEQVQAEINARESQLRQELETETRVSVARLEAEAQERQFQYEIVRSQLERQGATNADRAAVLLFLARAGVLNALDPIELANMAREQQADPNTTIIPELVVDPFDLIDRSRLYPNRSVITYSFLEQPSENTRRVVEAAIDEWSQHISLTFAYVDDPLGAMLRIMPEADFSRTRVGTAALEESTESPTMWLRASLSMPEALHEFGHVLGMVDEILNPRMDVSIDQSALVNLYSGSGHYIRTMMSLFFGADTYPCARSFDPNSIMMIEIPSEATSDGRAYEQGSVLSASDIACAGQMYPRRNPT